MYHVFRYEKETRPRLDNTLSYDLITCCICIFAENFHEVSFSLMVIVLNMSTNSTFGLIK